MQNHTWRQTNWKFWFQDRSKTRLLATSFSLPPGYGLHQDRVNWRKMKRNPMDNVATTGRLRFRRRYSPRLQYTTTNARKTSLLAETSSKLGLRPNKSKTKVRKINAKRKQPIEIKDTNLEEVEEFTCLGSIVNIEGGTDACVKNRINKARVIFNILGKVWSAMNISRGTKMKIF